MKKIQPLLLLTMSLLLVLLSNCDKNNGTEAPEPYEVEVAILSPTDNAKILAGTPFDVIVDYVRTEKIVHNIKVEIVDVQGVVVTKLVERHAHIADQFTFEKKGVIIQTPGTYFVQASTTDLDATETALSDSNKNWVEHVIVIE